MTHTLTSTRKELRQLLPAAASWLAVHGFALLAVFGVLLAVVWTLVHPYDHAWLAVIRTGAKSSSALTQIARQVSYWGDFLGLNLATFAAMLVIARCRQKPDWVRLALATLLSACTTGVVAVLIRTGLGRARPSSQFLDDFYGWQWTSALQSCPSGHTATAFGLAIPLLVADARLGVPAFFVATSVAWSRLYLNQHYPADVLTSICLSLLIGIPFGMAVRRQNRLDQAKRR